MLKNRKGMSYSEIAKRTGLSVSVVWRALNSRTMPTYPTVKKIASLFEISPIEFYKFVEENRDVKKDGN